MAPSPLDKQTACCKSAENGINGNHLAVFSVDIAISHHLHYPQLSTSIGVLVVLATPLKISKMAGTSDNYTFNSCCTGRLKIAIES